MTEVKLTTKKIYGDSENLWRVSVFLLHHLLRQLDRGCSQLHQHMGHRAQLQNLQHL